MGTARAEGPGQEGMANSGGRPMFRTERQELSQVSHCFLNPDIFFILVALSDLLKDITSIILSPPFV